jgi:2-polyprenyl-3-methyl-5-hydroxy-6-metoxy-1,4-benzoquinol methylase
MGNETSHAPDQFRCFNKGDSMNEKYVLKINSTLDKESLIDTLRSHEPWGHRIDFINTNENYVVSTTQLKRRTPFSENTLQKFYVAAEHIPFEKFRGGQLLDIGCNSGYNSIHASTTYDMRTVGVDVAPRHMKVSRFLAELAGAKSVFTLASAETFSRPSSFHVALHFGTLYHLPNPFLSLQTTFANLKPGGYLALETQTYDNPADPNYCYFMYMHNNDHTNFWAISQAVLIKMLEIVGFNDIKTAMSVTAKGLGENMHRTILVARKPK